MPEFLVRSAYYDDAERIMILSELLGYPLKENRFCENLKKLINHPQHLILVICINSKVYGFIHLCEVINIITDPYCEIMALIIDEEKRGMGLGRLLLEESIEWVKNKKICTIKVSSNIVRIKAHGFYIKNNFQLIKTQHFFIKNL